MRDSFDAYQYLGYLRSRWRFVVVVCGVAAALALLAGLLVTRRYTATASILIDPPAGNDPRTATAVSPVYLESLRTYEMFAASDSLFGRAAAKFRLRSDASQSLEGLKRRVLKVTKVRDTKILQIEVTLADPKEAQALAQFIAEETVNLSRTLNRDTDQDLIEDAQRQIEAARAELDRAQAAVREAGGNEEVEALRSEVDALVDTRLRLRRQIAEAQPELPGMRARIDRLEKQSEEMEREIRAKTALLTRKSTHNDELAMRLRTAQNSYEASAARQRDLRMSAGLRGERLRVIDPGVVPERPSSPNVGLGVAAALLVGLVASLTWLTLAFRPSGDA